jgi:hypothetical protein
MNMTTISRIELRRRWAHRLAVAIAGILITVGCVHAATPLAQEFAVVYHNPDPEYYVAGVGFERFADGNLVAVVPVIPRAAWNLERRATRSRTHIVSSGDGGRSWRPLATLPYYSAVPWIHGGKLYLFAHKGGSEIRSRDVLLLRSEDAGRTWSRELLLFTGQYWNSHTSVLIRDRRVYYAVDDLELDPNRGLRVLAGDLSTDPMDHRAWRLSAPLPFPGIPPSLVAPALSGRPNVYTEPNVIEMGGRIRLLASMNIEGQTTAGLGAVLDVHDDGQELKLAFAQFHPAPGAQVKRAIIRDERSKLYWATANLAVDSQETFGWWDPARAGGTFMGGGGNDRRFLMLLYSADGLNWFQAGCIARASKLSQSFMYARPVIDGEDLAILVRTSIRAPNQHDADHATFHRVRDFRKLAMNLFPEPETR